MINQQKAIISKLTLDVQELRNQNQELQNSLQNLESTVIEKQKLKSARKQDNISSLLSVESRIIKLENELQKYKVCHNGSVFSDENCFTLNS